MLKEVLETKIKDEYDVCVCGGGFAGIAAAMTDDFTTLDVENLQNVLKDNGVVLHEKDL